MSWAWPRPPWSPASATWPASWGEKEIRVNGLSAGPIRTLAARGIRDFNAMLRIHAERAALKRNNEVDEIGDAALFLCSRLSRGMTGEVMYVDAGYRIMGL